MGTGGPARRQSQDRHLRAIVDALIHCKELQRPALAKRLGLPKQVVSELMGSLEKQGLVQVSGQLGGLPGRSDLVYALQPAARLAMGFDIGADQLRAAIVDLRGTILCEHKEPLAEGGVQALTAQIGRLAEGLCQGAGVQRYRLQACVLAVPAAIDPDSGDTRTPGMLPPLMARLEPMLGCPVFMENDANLALLAELLDGQAQGRRDVAFVMLGEGVGAGLLVNGRLLRGAHGGAGEIGTMPLLPRQGGPKAEMHLEAALSEAEMVGVFRNAGGQDARSVAEIFRRAETGCAAAARTVQHAAHHAATAMAALIALVDPEIVVLGGSMGAQPLLRDAIACALGERFGLAVPILASSGGRRASLLGAAALARRRLLTALVGPGAAPQDGFE